MSVRVYLSGNEVHDRVLKAFYDGCPEEKKLVEKFEYAPSDIAVVFGVYKSKVRLSWPRGKVFRQQRESKKDVIVLETGYVNRGDGENHHYAAGFNGLNGRADFRNKSMGIERWEKLEVQLKPYRRGSEIVLCGQVPWDASVEGSDHIQWLRGAADKLRQLTTRTIKFRPHPLAKQAFKDMPGCVWSEGSLTDDLKTAHAVVTYNSNSAVEALIDGLPVFAADHGSMVWNLANKNLGDIESPSYPDRRQWAAELAYCQWTPAEMAEGKAWSHLIRP